MDTRVRAAIAFMKTNSRLGISVAEVARLVSLSPWHFTHLFKAETRKSPMQYLKQVRMRQAEQMLAETMLSLKEVVAAVGLSDRSHFSREFKRLHGLSPRAFIAQKRDYPSRRQFR